MKESADVRSVESALTVDLAYCLTLLLPASQAWVTAALVTIPSATLGGLWMIAPAVAVLAAALWSLIGGRRLQQLLPLKAGRARQASVVLMQNLVLPLRPSRRGSLSIAVLLGISLVVPGWHGPLIWAFLLLVASTYYRMTHRALLACSLALLAGTTLLVACSVVAPRFAPALSVSLLVFATATACSQARQGNAHRWLPAVATLVLVQASVIAGPAFFLPDRVAVPASLLTACLLLPAATYLTAMTYQSKKRQDLADELSEAGARASLGTVSSVQAEDTVRESDGYYRVLYPRFRSAHPAVSSEAGYLTWLGDRDGVSLSGEAIVLRATSLSRREEQFTQTVDPLGTAIAMAVRDVLLGVDMAAMRPLQSALRDVWCVAVARGRNQALVKMPWDHPLMMVIPSVWSKTWLYPVGAGIHDRDGYPCQVRKAEVSIQLRPSTVAAARAVAAGSSDEAERVAVRSLASNMNRILPAVYEGLLMQLVKHGRKDGTDIFFTDAESTAVNVTDRGLGARGTALAEISEGLSSSIAPELGALVEVKVLDLRLEALYAGEAREVVERYRRAQITQLQDKWRDARRLRDTVRDRVLGDGQGERRGASQQEAEVELRDVLSKAVHASRSNIDAAGREAVKQLSQLAQAGRHANAFPLVQRALVEEHDRFSQRVEDAFDDFDAALLGLMRSAREHDDVR